MGDISDIWNEESAVPFWGTTEQLRKLSSLVDQCIEIVNESDNPREMVLETWLVLDYAIRDFLLGGYDLQRFCDEDFDLRYTLLPKSFEELLRLLEVTIRSGSSLSREPGLRYDYPPEYTASLRFMKYLRENYGDILDKFNVIRTEYIAKRNPELAKAIEEGRAFHIRPRRERVQGFPEKWLEVASNLGDDWFSLARRLNRARNRAAHSYDPAAVAEAFGVTDPQTVSLVRDECLQLLRRLLGIRSNDGGGNDRNRYVEGG